MAGSINVAMVPMVPGRYAEVAGQATMRGILVPKCS